MTTIEDNDGQPKAKLHWGVPEISALLSILAALAAGGGVAIKVAIAQDRTEARSVEALRRADQASDKAESLGGDVREMKTDLRWIRERLERGVR